MYPDGWLNTPPTANIKEPCIVYVNQTITCDGSGSSDVEGKITYFWTFGDGTNGSGEYTDHIYTSAGTYTVTLVVTDEFGVTRNDTTFAHIWDSTEGEWIFNAINDSYVFQKIPSINYGSESYLDVSNNYGNNSSDWQRQLLMKFNLSTIPSITNITQAQLYLYYYDYEKNDTVGRNLSIRRITSNWDENNLTWNNRPTNSSKNTSNSVVPSSFGWMSWNVLSDIQGLIKEGDKNYGWQIMDLKCWGAFDIPVTKFKSKETQTDYKPFLKISYSTPLIPYTHGIYQGNADDEIQFNGSFLGFGTPPYQWGWDFGEGNTSNEQNATHAYSNAGNYTVNLTIKDSNGKGGTSSTVAIIEDEKRTSSLVKIIKPIKGLYIHDEKKMSLRKTGIIGEIDIEVDVSYEEWTIEKVEFYIDDTIQETVNEKPYTWTWNKKTPFRFRYVIKVTAYDVAGNSASDEVVVWRLF